ARLGSILEVARGGSPRPIQEYLTTAENGVNWIKIGDTDKGGKYISHTKEKIKPEGIAKSRYVHSGDFLLTNSMSFGRPYILKTDGCIHDGWLVLSDHYNCCMVDFLYYILSSPFAYYQFCENVSGAVVKNLNSEKVANSLFPLPPLIEQNRIAAKIESLLPLIQSI
uniref:restriction endonuclease subunit S n=1 Tax=Duncaniella muris TaxID=2094150 RepID=UPI0025A1C198